MKEKNSKVEITYRIHTKTCTQVFIAALFIIAQGSNNPNAHQLMERYVKGIVI